MEIHPHPQSEASQLCWLSCGVKVNRDRGARPSLDLGPQQWAGRKECGRQTSRLYGDQPAETQEKGSCTDSCQSLVVFIGSLSTEWDSFWLIKYETSSPTLFFSSSTWLMLLCGGLLRADSCLSPSSMSSWYWSLGKLDQHEIPNSLSISSNICWKWSRIMKGTDGSLKTVWTMTFFSHKLILAEFSFFMKEEEPVYGPEALFLGLCSFKLLNRCFNCDYSYLFLTYTWLALTQFSWAALRCSLCFSWSEAVMGAAQVLLKLMESSTDDKTSCSLLQTTPLPPSG